MASEEPVIDWKEINLQESRSEISRLDTPDGYPKAPSWSLKTEFAHEYTSPLYGADPKMVEAALLGRSLQEEEDADSPLDASAKVLEERRQQEEEHQEGDHLDELPVEADLDFMTEEEETREPVSERGKQTIERDVEEIHSDREEPIFSSELEEEDFFEDEEDEQQERELLHAALRQEEEDDEAILSQEDPGPMDLDSMLEEDSSLDTPAPEREDTLQEVLVESSNKEEIPKEREQEALEELDILASKEAEEESDSSEEESDSEEEVSESEEEEESQGLVEVAEEAVEEAEESAEEVEEAESAEEAIEEAEGTEEAEAESAEMDWLDEDEEWDMQMPSFAYAEDEEDDLDFDDFFHDEEEEEVSIGSIEVEDTYKGLESADKPQKKSKEKASKQQAEEKASEQHSEVKASEQKAEEKAPEQKAEEKASEQKEKIEKSAPAKEAAPVKAASATRKAASGTRKSARPGTVKGISKAARAANARRSHMAGFIIGMALLALGTVYAAISYYYVDHFVPGTSINGISVAGLTAYEAEQSIAQNVEKYVISVASRNFETQEIAGSSIDYKYLSDGGVLNLMKHQNPLTWIFGYLHRTNYSAAKNVTFNKGLLRSQLKSLDCARDENQVSPQNAYITMDGNTFSIVPETQGAELKMKEAYRLLDDAISQGVKEIDFTSEAGVYEEATLTADSTAMHNMLDAYNNYATANITLQFGKEKEILDGDTLKNWLEFDEKGELVQDSSVFDQHIWNYIGQLAEKYDTVGTSRAVQATADGRTVYVYGYSYGWQIDQNAEFTQLQSEITQGLQVTREPNFAMRANAYWPNDIGNTYIEVDMGYQHMYYYQNGYLIFDSDFVSGNVNIPGRATPEGIYTLYAKQSPAVLKGEISETTGKPEYETEVSYWMPFNGGVGFHDADWQPYFGYDLYLTNGSHGCINLPYYAAAQLYEIIDYDVPILCFY